MFNIFKNMIKFLIFSGAVYYLPIFIFGSYDCLYTWLASYEAASLIYSTVVLCFFLFDIIFVFTNVSKHRIWEILFCTEYSKNRKDIWFRRTRDLYSYVTGFPHTLINHRLRKVAIRKFFFFSDRTSFICVLFLFIFWFLIRLYLIDLMYAYAYPNFNGYFMNIYDSLLTSVIEIDAVISYVLLDLGLGSFFKKFFYLIISMFVLLYLFTSYNV